MKHPQQIVEALLGYAVAWDDTAAWAQAIGAMVAIGLTWFVTHREARDRIQRERADDRRHATVQRALAHSAFVLVSEAQRLAQSTLVERDLYTPSPSDTEAFVEMARSLAEFPIHSVENERVMQMVIVARSGFAELRDHLRSPFPPEPAILSGLCEGLSNCAEALLLLLTADRASGAQAAPSASS